jgi:hypothetical protein
MTLGEMIIMNKHPSSSKYDYDEDNKMKPNDWLIIVVMVAVVLITVYFFGVKQ